MASPQSSTPLMWAESIFAREAVSLQVASRLCLADIASMLAVCATTAAVFREAGSLTIAKSGQHSETAIMDLVCCALGASLSSGLMDTHFAALGGHDHVCEVLPGAQEGQSEGSYLCIHFAARIEHGAAEVDCRDRSFRLLVATVSDLFV
eukprot:Skav226045  [mRNA]  locus=scaffold211:55142:57279:+ [translate_table: standard]